MPSSHRRLMLHCDALNSRFVLAQEGEDWRQFFDSFEDAYEQAGARATDTTPLVLFNELGTEILETSVFPPGDFRPPVRPAGDLGRVLIIDDEVESSLALRIVLEDLGYIVEVERDAAKALATARRFRPWIVLINFVTEPGGGDLAWQIAGDPAFKNVKLIVCSRVDASGFRQDLPLTGVPFLEKPIRVEQLLQLLE